MNKLKYPLYLFLMILLVKIGYIALESYYNYYVLTVTTTTPLTKETIENLNINGHRISAIGITLLLFPFLYYLARSIKERFAFLIVLVLSSLSYLVLYEGLNQTVTKIVEINKEKRHDAYYVNVFKYGVLNNIFVYDSFIDSEKIKNNTLDVNDRILLSNSFLLLHADEKLITKLKQRGKEKVADVYIEKNLKEDFKEKKEQFRLASVEVVKLWNAINKNKIRIDQQLQMLNEENMNKGYDELVQSLRKNYKSYVEAWMQIDAKIEKETAPDRLRRIEDNLRTYFRYESFQRVRNRYKESMDENFGHYIEPYEWQDNVGMVSQEQIKYVIKKEILQAARIKLHNLPPNLGVKDFMYHYEVKYVVMKKLQENDILVPFDFNYSYEEFIQYFKIMAAKKYAKAYALFYEKLEKEIGVNDIRLDMDYSNYIYSGYIQTKIQEKLPDLNEEDITNTLDALNSKDLASFRSMVYLPKISEQVKFMNFEKDDFLDGGNAEHYGDDAIKLLYIPPFALALSMIGLLLNALTVLSMTMTLLMFPSKLQFILKYALIFSITLIPISHKNENVNTNLLQQSTTNAQLYLNFLAWISYFEKNNSDLHEKYKFKENIYDKYKEQYDKKKFF
ncbi:hypothetical protein JHD48_00975 [Sulfurimonas sp. SAG-AH-194-I05]|nr:hypothetical protein [Sulfurimonas sp. SAG-AH-194-I05]MDF1874300.1 hypothetical protein [Sulfurimonas sp. SAG-AH-194-I05]